MENSMPDIKFFQIRVANTCLDVSSLRGQSKGTKYTANRFLKELDLKNIPHDYGEWLDKQTECLRSKLPDHDFGAARKALNIFMLEVAHNTVLSSVYGLDKVIPFLEVPLDNINAKILLRHARERGMRLKWTSIKALDKETNDAIQAFAQRLAQEEFHMCRCYLEWIFWKQDD